MPGLTYLPQFERHLTLAALGHCPRHYDYLRQIREGLLPEPVPSDSLTLGIGVHMGLAGLYEQSLRQEPWDAARALDGVEARLREECRREVASIMPLVRSGVQQYAEHWGPVRAGWNIVAVNPGEEQPTPPWCFWGDWFVTFPDLIVAQDFGRVVTVLDHKTGRYPFRPTDWQHDPQLLTQCLCVSQGFPRDVRVLYGIDYLQKPGTRSSVWSLPVTPLWEFTPERAEEALEWLELGYARLAFYRGTTTAEGSRGGYGFVRDQAACKTIYGTCEFWEECFGEGGEEETEG